MADTPNYCSSYVLGASSSLETSGLTLSVPDYFDSIPSVRFRFNTDDIRVSYTDANDKVYLVTTEGHKIELTREGDCWKFTQLASHFDAFGLRPNGSSASYNAQLVFTRKDSGSEVRTVAQSFPFTLTIERYDSFSPSLWGTPIVDLDAWDLSETEATTISSWEDRTVYERNADEATNFPTVQFDPLGRACARFDGTNDKLVTSTSIPIDAAFTAFVVARVRGLSTTYQPILTIGNVILKMNNANLRVSLTADVDYAHTTLDNTWFVGTMTKAASTGAQTVGMNLGAASTGGTHAMTAGTLKLAYDGTNFGNCDIAKVLVFNAVLSATNLELAKRALMGRYGVS